MFHLPRAYLGLVILANWLAERLRVNVPLTPYQAPAGVFCIGLGAGAARLDPAAARALWTMPLVYTAGLISWGVGDLAGWKGLKDVSVASVIAFTVSETVEAAGLHADS